MSHDEVFSAVIGHDSYLVMLSNQDRVIGLNGNRLGRWRYRLA